MNWGKWWYNSTCCRKYALWRETHIIKEKPEILIYRNCKLFTNDAFSLKCEPQEKVL